MFELMPNSRIGMNAIGHRHRNRDDGDERARHVPQEDEDDDGDDRQLLEERVPQVVDRSEDQVRPVVRGDDLHALRQRRLELLQLRLHAVDHPQRVLALPHHDDPRDDVAGAVEVGDAAAEVRPERHRADVPHAHRARRGRWSPARCRRCRRSTSRSRARAPCIRCRSSRAAGRRRRRCPRGPRRPPSRSGCCRRAGDSDRPAPGTAGRTRRCGATSATPGTDRR